MEKLLILAIAIGVLVLIGLIYSVMTRPTTTTTKEVIVRQPVVVAQPPHRYGYAPPPHMYNPYKGQYY